MLGIILAVRLLKIKRCEGLFAKLNSGATNSVGGTSERSVPTLHLVVVNKKRKEKKYK